MAAVAVVHCGSGNGAAAAVAGRQQSSGGRAVTAERQISSSSLAAVQRRRCRWQGGSGRVAVAVFALRNSGIGGSAEAAMAVGGGVIIYCKNCPN